MSQALNPDDLQLTRAGRLIRQWCATHNVSQSELNRRLGFGKGWVYNVVSGRQHEIDFARLRGVAEVTGLDFVDLTSDLTLPAAQQVRSGPRMDAVLAAVEGGGSRSARHALGSHWQLEIVRNVKRLERLTGKPLGDIPADPQWFRHHMAGWNAPSFGMTPRAMEKLKSSINVALEIAGAKPHRNLIKRVGPEWRALYDSARAYEKKRGIRCSGRLYAIRPFIRSCDAHKVKPADADESTVAAYASERARYDLKECSAATRMRAVENAWNYFATHADGWPRRRLTIERKARLAPVPEEFPDSFSRELREYVFCLGVKNPDRYDVGKVGYLPAAMARRQASEKAQALGVDDPFKPLADSTAEQHAYLLRRVAAALVQAGVLEMHEVTSISAVATIEGIAELMEDYHKRHGENPGKSSRETYVRMIASVALRWREDLSQEELALFREMRSQVRSRRTEMSEEDRSAIEPFLHDEELMAKLISLPLWIHRKVEYRRKQTGHVTERDAVELEAAVALMIETSLCPRLITVVRTRHRRIGWPRRPGAYGWITWAPEDVKNDKAMRAQLSPWKVEILRDFLHWYWPVLARDPKNPYLFPARSPQNRRPHKSRSRLARNMKKLASKIGRPIRAHLWRKVVGGFLFQKTKDERVLRALFGHSQNSAATQYYVDQLKTLWASATLDKIMEHMLTTAPPKAL